MFSDVFAHITVHLQGKEKKIVSTIYTSEKNQYYKVIQTKYLSQFMTKPTIINKRLISACTSTQYCKVLIYPSLDSLEAVEGTCDQQRL